MEVNISLFRSMAPLYLPGLDENGAVENFYPESWNKSKPGSIGITAGYNFFTRHQNQLLPDTIFFPGRQVQAAGYNFFPSSSEMLGTIFFPQQ